MTEPDPRSRRRARVVATIASATAAVATGVLPIVVGGGALRPQLVLAAIALVLLGVGLGGWTPGLTLAAIGLAAEYAIRLPHHHAVDGFAIVEAVALFATVELGLRALEARSVARPEPAMRRYARSTLAALLGGAAGCAFLVLVLGSRRLPAPTAGLALGLAATAGVLVAAELVRRGVSRAS